MAENDRSYGDAPMQSEAEMSSEQKPTEKIQSDKSDSNMNSTKPNDIITPCIGDTSVTSDLQCKEMSSQSTSHSSETTSTQDDSLAEERLRAECGLGPREEVEVKVIFNKKKHDVKFPLDETILNFKKHIEGITSVPYSMQKVMFKGLMQDTKTLRELKVTKGSKIMVVGSTVSDVLSMSAPDPVKLREEEKASAAASKEPLSSQKPHKTVLEKHGKPDDALPGIKNRRDSLPPVPISGMYNKHGGKVRLTFKLEQDQLWIGTKERTEKLPMSSIKNVTSEPIHTNDAYHMMGIQLGPTEASRYWIYWVPAQYVDAIKEAVLGNWQLF